MMVVASAARRARYWPTVMPPMSVSAGTKVFSVTGVATLPIRIRLPAVSKMVWWIGSKKCFGSRKSDTR